MADGTAVVSACVAAGFTGQALLNIVAIGHRESGWDESIQGDLGIMDSTWGPSVGVFQIRTLRADTGTGSDRDIQALIPGATVGAQNSGRGDLARQAAAAWTISGGGADLSPWSTWRGLSQADMDAAQNALNSMSPTDLANAQKGKTTLHAGSDGGGVLGDLTGAIDKGLGAVLGYDGTFSDWAGMVVLRVCEVVGGGVLIAAGAICMLDVMTAGRAPRQSGPGDGLIARSVRQGVQLGKRAAMTAAAA